MDKISVKVLRDLANNPSIVEIMKNNRKITATFDPNTGLVLEGPSGQLPNVAEILQMAYPYEMPSSARPAWYDRNPKSKIIGYDNQGVAPHVTTERISFYTVPADKIVIINFVYIQMVRSTVAAPVGEARTEIRLTPYGDSEEDFITLIHFDNTVGATQQIVGSNVPLFAGDKLRAVTRDLSTGGEMAYCIRAKLTEFDE